MLLTRRTFSTMLAGLTVAAFAQRPTARADCGSWPVLRGDGINDDTIALASLLAGGVVTIPESAPYHLSRLSNGSVTLIGGTFRVSGWSTDWIQSPSHILRDVIVLHA